MFGDSLDRVLRQFYRENGSLVRAFPARHLPYSTKCSAHSCHQCANPACPYADFIHLYVACPRCD